MEAVCMGTYGRPSVQSRRMNPAETQPAETPSWTQDWSTLVKVRLSLLVLATTLVGFLVAEPDRIDWPRLGWTLAGTFLSAAAAVNRSSSSQVICRALALVPRPLPASPY
jgi:heme O synthase-like polyprenyltransferase